MKTTKGSIHFLKALALGTIAVCCAWVPAQATPAPVTVTFRNGAGAGPYSGTVDTYIGFSNAANTTPLPSEAAAPLIVADGNPINQILLRFDSIFGTGVGQIPSGSTITSATLTLFVGSTANDQSANPVNFHRLLHSWSATDLYAVYGASPWNLTPGIQADGVDALAAIAATSTMNTLGVSSAINVTTSLQAWLSSPSSNFGWAILPTGTDGLRLESSESTFASNARRPTLSVTFIPPCTTNAECNDGASCTTDTCSSGVCQNVSTCVGGLSCNVTSSVCEAVRSFQNGFGSYGGTFDTYIGFSNATNTTPLPSEATAPLIVADGNPINQILLRFDSIFGTGLGQIPSGSTITSATLTLFVGSAANDQSANPVNFHQLLHSWSDADLWATYGFLPWNLTAGIQADGVDALAAIAATSTMNTLGVSSAINVTTSLQAWLSSPSSNFGWAILPTGTDGLRLESSESTTASNARRPRLSVVLTCLWISATDATCDGVDDDCDGVKDEDVFPAVTTCGVGACVSHGLISCSNGALVDSGCTAGTPGATETSGGSCNGIDDDCDGIADPGCSGSFALVAKAFPKIVNGTPVDMWGFALDTAGCDSLPTVPGPRLTLPVGVSNLTLSLRNCLPAGSPPISLAIPGLARALDPTFVRADSTTYTAGRAGGDVTSRIRSFDTEIAPGSSHAYTWTGVRPGTYLYESGSNPAVQVPMGLYGALTHDTPLGEAYLGVPYTNEALLIYSEIDPTRPFVSSALGYQPSFFLVNGETGPYPMAPPMLNHALLPNERVLLRFVNAGLQSHVPTFLGAYLQAVAEDAHPYPYARDQYGVLLPAGKTLDAIWTADTCSGSVPLFDRRLWLSNPGVPTTPGGMLVTFGTSHDPTAPAAVDDPYTVALGNTLIVPALTGVLANDTKDTSLSPMTAVLVTGPTNGTLSLAADGSFRYTPSGTLGPDTFTYKANDCEDSNVATVTVTVTAGTLNLPPGGVPDTYIILEDGRLPEAAPGVLGNDSDENVPGLTASLSTGVSHGTLIFNSNGSFDYTPLANYNGPDSFTYRAFDGQFFSGATIVDLIVTAVPDAPVANDDTAQTIRQAGVKIFVLRNDADADAPPPPPLGVNADIDVTSVTRVVSPRNGSAVFNTDGTVDYTANAGFLGTDTFSYTVRDVSGALSNVAVVRVNVTK